MGGSKGKLHCIIIFHSHLRLHLKKDTKFFIVGSLLLPKWRNMYLLVSHVDLSFKIVLLSTLLKWIQESDLLFLHILNVWPYIYQLFMPMEMSATCHTEVYKI